MQIKVTRVAANTSAGDQDILIADMTETPNGVLIIVSAGVTNNSRAGHSILSFGAATGVSNQWVMGFFDNSSAGPTDSAHDVRSDALISIRVTTVDGVAAFVSFLSDSGSGAGVRINWSNAPSNARLMTVVLFSVPGIQAGLYTTGASNGSTTNVTTDFETSLLICCSGVNPEDDNIAHFLGSIGFCDNDLNQWSYMFRNNDAVSPTVLAARLGSNRVAGQTTASGTETWGSEITAIDSTSFTATQRTAGGASDVIGYLAVGGVLTSVDQVDVPTSIGDQAVTGIGGEPQFLCYLVTNTEAVDTAYTDNRAATFSLGFYDGGTQYSHSWMSKDNIGSSQSESRADTGAIAPLYDEDGTAIALGGGTGLSMDSDGWIIGWGSNVPATAKKTITFAVLNQDGNPWYYYAQN